MFYKYPTKTAQKTPAKKLGLKRFSVWENQSVANKNMKVA